MGALDHDLERATAAVGHSCSSIKAAVSMINRGCRRLGVSDARQESLIVYVEMDKCATAATASVIGRPPLGLRHLTFGGTQGSLTLMDLRSERGVRVGMEKGRLTLVDVEPAQDPVHVPGRGLREDFRGHTLPEPPLRGSEPIVVNVGPLRNQLAVAPAAGCLQTLLLSLGPWPLRAGAGPPAR